MRMIKVVLFAFFVASALTLSAHQGVPAETPEASHSGGTDKCGCHHNSKTGEYHCHKRKQRGGDCPP